VGGDVKDLHEFRKAIALVSYGISRDRVGQLVERVQVRGGTDHRKRGVARTGSRGGLDGADGRGRRGRAVDGVHAEKVRAEIRDDDEFLGRVQHGVVQVGSLLAVGTRAGRGEGVVGLGEEDEVLGVGDVERGKSRRVAWAGSVFPFRDI